MGVPCREVGTMNDQVETGTLFQLLSFVLSGPSFSLHCAF